MYQNLSWSWLIGKSEERVLQFDTFMFTQMSPSTSLEDVSASHVIVCIKTLGPIWLVLYHRNHTLQRDDWSPNMFWWLAIFASFQRMGQNWVIKKSCTHRVLWRSWWASRRWTPPAPPSWASHPSTTPFASQNCPSPGVWKGCCSTFCLDRQDGHAAGFFLAHSLDSRLLHVGWLEFVT